MNIQDMKYYRSVAYKTEVYNVLSGSQELRVTESGVQKVFKAWTSNQWRIVHYVKHDGKRIAFIFDGYHHASGTCWYLHEAVYLHNGKRLRRVLENRLLTELLSRGRNKSIDLSDLVARKKIANRGGFNHTEVIEYRGFTFYIRKSETSSNYWVTKADSATYYDTYWQLAKTMRQVKIKIKEVVDYWEHNNVIVYKESEDVSSVRS